MTTKNPVEIDAIAVIGVDMEKTPSTPVDFDVIGWCIFWRNIKRLALKATFQGLTRCVADMKACMSVRFVRRMLRALGFWASDRPNDLRQAVQQRTKGAR